MERSLSILLPVHNVQSTLARCVHRVLDAAEELTDRFEVLIIDDGSTDHTIEIAHEVARYLPQVKVVRNATPRGLAAAVREGLQRTTGEIVCVHEGSGAIDVTDLRRLWQRRNQTDLVLAREGRTEEERWLNRLLGPQNAPALGAGGGFHMLRRDAIAAVERNEPLIAGSGEICLRRDRAEAAHLAARPNFIDRLRRLALGE